MIRKYLPYIWLPLFVLVIAVALSAYLSGLHYPDPFWWTY